MIDENEIAELPVYHHESGYMFAEDIEQHLVVLPEMSTATEEVKIDDIQIGDPDVPLTTDQQKLISLYGRAVTFLWEGQCPTASSTRGGL